MSFWDTLKRVGAAAIKIESVAVPIASIVDPALAAPLSLVDKWVHTVQGAVLTVEQNNPADGQGGIKSVAVIADFQAGLSETQSILAAMGKKLTYDEAALQEAINGFVAGYNALAKVKASFKEVDL